MHHRPREPRLSHILAQLLSLKTEISACTYFLLLQMLPFSTAFTQHKHPLANNGILLFLGISINIHHYLVILSSVKLFAVHYIEHTPSTSMNYLRISPPPPPPFITHTHTQTHSLTVAEVNQYLDDLAQSNVKKDRPGVKKALQLLLRNTSAVEQKWLIRIILKVCILFHY